MVSKEKDLRESISKNLNAIIASYVKEKDNEKLM
jgi:hypothetical protein